MFGMGHWEILIIFVVILLIFGAKRIPEMAQGLGKGIREFRTAMRDVQEEIDINPPPANPPANPPAQAPTQTVSQSGDKEQAAT
ncbi:MAG: twin-arginine translocase TatA/TatE family subunit [Candidatus Latescibacterota bacterium]|nr:twin-arginine translocase TatA/TatE family subunit [Candidatus Latescibacterota bacterium]